MRILGVDPGLQKTGWGVIESKGSSLKFISTGLIQTSPTASFAERLHEIDKGLAHAVELHKPDETAIEETFVNNNPSSTLKLGMARGAAIASLARGGLPVAEYAARFVKKAIAGSGRADKNQMGTMIRHLLVLKESINPDQADALAVAICHANHAKSPENLIQRKT